MITTITLNAALDITYTLPQFAVGEVHRTAAYICVPGGKGVNAARVVHSLGEQVVTTGFAAGHQGAAFLAGLTQEQLPADFVICTQGETRRAITILDSNNQTSTEIIEQGPLITDAELPHICQKTEELSKKSSWVILSGSLPSGCPASLVPRLLRIARQKGAKIALDARGEALREGLLSQPDLLRINEHEAAEMMNNTTNEQHPPDDDQLLKWIEQQMRSGIPMVIVSQGAKGALAGCQGQLYRMTFPQVEAVNPVGSGDAMMAGLVVGMVQGRGDIETLKLGTSCGLVNALHTMAGYILPEQVTEWKDQIEVIPLSSL